MRSIDLAIGAAVVALAASSLAGSASATPHTLTFDQSNACGVAACGDGSAISANYGSVAGLQISYNSYDNLGNHLSSSMYSWDTQYGDLTDIAYAAGGDCCSVGEITFQVTQPGVTFTFIDAMFASWPNVDRTTQISLLRLDRSLFGTTGPITAPGAGHYSVTCSCTTTSGFILQFGPDAFNTGVDNIRFDVSGATGTVPEPAGWALMLAGFGALGSALRLRRRVVLAA